MQSKQHRPATQWSNVSPVQQTRLPSASPEQPAATGAPGRRTHGAASEEQQKTRSRSMSVEILHVTPTTAQRAKMAYVSIRQSSLMQVTRHAESTDLQYSLVERAIALGWPKLPRGDH